jgi:hypothetical protein
VKLATSRAPSPPAVPLPFPPCPPEASTVISVTPAGTVKLSSAPVNANVQVTVAVPEHDGAAPAGGELSANGLRPTDAVNTIAHPHARRDFAALTTVTTRFEVGAC